MKKLLTLIVVILLSNFLYPQEDKFPKFCISLGGGAAVPVSPDNFVNYWDIGYNLSLGIEGSVSSLISFNIDMINYSVFSLSEEEYLNKYFPELNDAQVEGRDAKTYGFLFTFKFKFFDKPKKFFPYIRAGIGVSSWQFDEAKVTSNTDNYIIGEQEIFMICVNAGLGIQYNISESFSVFLDAEYISGSGDNGFLGDYPSQINIRLMGSVVMPGWIFGKSPWSF
jgi:hypothetical protein